MGRRSPTHTLSNEYGRTCMSSALICKCVLHRCSICAENLLPALKDWPTFIFVSKQAMKGAMYKYYILLLPFKHFLPQSVLDLILELSLCSHMYKLLFTRTRRRYCHRFDQAQLARLPALLFQLVRHCRGIPLPWKGTGLVKVRVLYAFKVWILYVS